jgi:hypothetical protein
MTHSRQHDRSESARVIRITQVRSEYTSARLICANLEHRLAGRRYERPAGYLPPEIDYHLAGGEFATIRVRDYDVRLLDRVGADEAVAHVGLIHRARRGDAAARARLQEIAGELHPGLAMRFQRSDLIETEHVIPYTTDRDYPLAQISDKGSVLLNLSRLGFATPDFNLLAAGVHQLDTTERRTCLHAAIHNLEKLSGRRLGDPRNPLLIAMRSAMPVYLPGFMPTYLNVGLTPALLPGLPARYGEEAAARIRLNSRRTLLEVLDPAAAAALEARIRPGLGRGENDAITAEIVAAIEARDPRLLDDPYHQLDFFLRSVYAYYDAHRDALRNFTGGESLRPTVILQRMVCSVIDRDSYAGVLYSRHPRHGQGVHLQYAREIYGEDLMTGRLVPEQRHLRSQEDARRDFPAVHHFWPRLRQLERVFGGPVMVEFTGVHGTFTILQVNEAELSGSGMLTAVMDLHREGEIDAARVRALIKPYHLRQLESDTIDPASLASLTPFCRGLSVLPRSAVTGRVSFSAETAGRDPGPRGAPARERRILVRPRFTPTDTIGMQDAAGIVSLSPAAIHVVTTAQTLGIPSLLDVEQEGVRLGEDGRSLVNARGQRIAEGDWVTISSRQKTLFVGKAVYATARLMRFMEGDEVELTGAERERFAELAGYYREYRALLESLDAGQFDSLQDLGQSIRSGELRHDSTRAAELVNRACEDHLGRMVEGLLATTLGMHLSNQSAYRLLTEANQARLLGALVAAARERGARGYQAGSFVIGCLVEPEAPCPFWERLDAAVIAELLDEWILHEKYQDLLQEVGERKLNQARGVLLSRGLGELSLHLGRARAFMPLKLSAVDLDAVAAALPAEADPQTGELLDLLRRPFRDYYDFDLPADLNRFTVLCQRCGRPMPGPNER